MSRLVNYICKREDIEYQSLHGIGDPQTPSELIDEVIAVQAMNDRAGDAQQLHLILSFHGEDELTDEKLAAIEHDVMDGLGIADHQRMSALHTDTDHPHLHIAVNKIHPETFKTARLSFSKMRLGEIAQQIEQKYKLKADNHQPNKLAIKADGAASLESQQGERSMISQLRELKTDLSKSNDWSTLHQSLANNGFKLEKQGQGAIFMRHDGVAIKCSRIKGYGLPSLEKRLGTYKPAPENITIKKITPVALAHPLKDLQQRYWVEYSTFKDKARVERTKTLQALKVDRERILTVSKEQHQLIKKNNIKGLRGLYSVNKMQRLAKLEALKVKRQAVPLVPGYADWLAKKAISDENALLLLRNRKMQPERNQIISGNPMQSPAFNPLTGLDGLVYTIKRNGDAVYALKDIRIRDRGKDIQINKTTLDQANLLYLKFAQSKYGSSLSLKGSDQFKRTLIDTANKAGLNITFTDEYSLKYQKSLGVSIQSDSSFSLDKFMRDQNPQDVSAFIRERVNKGEHYRVFDKRDMDKNFMIAGIRQANGQRVVLLSGDADRIVLPVSEDKAQELRRIKSQSNVATFQLTSAGEIKHTLPVKQRRKIK